MCRQHLSSVVWTSPAPSCSPSILTYAFFLCPLLLLIFKHEKGSTDKLPYVTMGSGSLAAMAVFEAHYKPGLEVLS